MSNKKKKREYLSMSDQHLADQEKMWDMMEELRERRRAKNLGYTRWRTKNKGGMMNINRMTAPLGYALGGPAGKVGRPTLAPELYEGFEPIHRGYGEALANINNPEYIHKWNMTKPRQPGLDEKLMQDYEPPKPRWEKLRKLGKKGKDLFTGIFGAKGAEAGAFTDDLDTSIRKLEIEIKSLQIDEMLMGEDNSKAIQSKSNLLEYYRSLQ